MASVEGLRKRGAAPALDPKQPTPVPDDSDDKQLKAAKKIDAVPSVFSDKYETWVLVALTFLAFWTRFYKIGWSDIVVWDEAHFGKFASYYIKREFYFDVHPPLGKMLLGFAGILAGYNGSFEFESGATYPPELNYTVMRMFSSTFGALMVPLAYLTARQLRLSKPAAILMAVMVLTDIALLVISRFILLDSMLLFFTCLSVYCLCTFRNYQRSSPFSPEWWWWLAATGASIGAVASVKWVGLFAIALVGLHTINDLWEMLGDLKMPKTLYIKHWVARIICLIALPISIYLLSFVLHFAILNRSGSGDAQMSSLFQAGLKGNSFHLNPLELAYGSKVSLKNNGHGGGLLHSHVQRYPTGSEQQQVTCYHHKDSNNDWIIKKPWGVPDPEDVEFVKDGDIIRLVHEQTKRNLHSHNVKAPVTTSDNEVSCYGNETVGDTNDHWKIEIVDDAHVRRPERIRSLTTRFRLRHVLSGCLLRSHGVTLPQWGFKQAEVLCQKSAEIHSLNNMWNIEQHWNDQLPPGGAHMYKSKFFKDFVDLNVAMWTSNNALTPDPDKEPDQLTSSPYQWPFLLVGLRMCGWGDDAIKFYLLGHPLIWWGSAISVIVFSGILFVYLIRWRRQYDDWKRPGDWSDFAFAGKVGLVGWFLHYFPFWIMGLHWIDQPIFAFSLHHYFPALYFGIILLTFTIDHLTSRLPQRLRAGVIFAIMAVIIAVYFYFADFAFGISGPAEQYKGRQWLSSWNFYDKKDVVETVESGDENVVGEEHAAEANTA
ncbi:Protein O-mannosyltransferase 2 [Quaeritorhiza haematococci]|nr:Protein O-mannosyltransferase 2 [Quaeritorhiza haematococci]